MTIRSLALFDLPLFYRYREDALTLDGTRALTRGNPLGALGFMNYLNPARHIYTAIADGKGLPLLGSITHLQGKSFAKLLFLAPQNLLEDAKLPFLIREPDHASRKLGCNACHC